MSYILLIGLFSVFRFALLTPLDDYVNTPDPHYTYNLVTSYKIDEATFYVLNMTSQKWYDESVLDKPIWWHFLTISIPDNLTKIDAATLIVAGGHNAPDLKPPKETDTAVQMQNLLAVSMGAVVATLSQIPNQPITFKKDPIQLARTEDQIIAWTWKEFLENPKDPKILLRMPMTKAAVRAMDTVSDFCAKNSKAKIERFMVAGASKRGWTTWTTAAVDPKRVFAAVPIVMDLLNINTNLHHHYRSLGGWTFAFESYYNLSILSHMDRPEMQAMQEIIDPYYYLDRYQNTKIYMINSAGDEFFLPDDPDYFWINLRAVTNGTCLLKRMPNADHYFKGHEISLVFSMRSFFLSAYNNVPLPRLSWTRPNNITHGITQVEVDIENGPVPSDVTVYYAETLDGKRRDFRLIIGDPSNPSNKIPHPVLWKSDSKLIQMQYTKTSIIYTASFPKPLNGWLGFYFQLSFPGPDNSTLEVGTEINIIPETFPFPDCYQDSCIGTLV